MMDGFNSSVLFMLTMIFTVLGGFAFLVWSSYKSGPRRLEELRKIADAERNLPG